MSIELGGNAPKKIYIRVDENRWTPTANTFAYYPLVSDFNDYSGNNYNLTNSGGVTIVDNVVSSALFTGATGGLYNNSVSLPIGNSVSTVSIRVCPTGFSSSEQNVRGFGKNSNAQFTILHKLNPISIGNRGSVLESGTVATLNTWQNIISVMSGTNTWTIYLNGNQIKTGNMTRNTQGSNLDLGFAYGNNNSNYNYRGYMSEAIFENKAWTSQEVSDYYNNYKSLFGIS